MKFPRQIRRVGESFLVCVGFAVLPFLPRRLIRGLSSGLGNAGYRCCRQLRRIAMANLDIAFGDALPTTDKEAILRESFRTFSLLLFDIFWFAVFTSRRIRRCIRLDPSMKHYFDAGPVIATTAHFGNWEVMGLAVALRGDPSLVVATPSDNPFVDRVLNRCRRTAGQSIAPRQGAIRTVVKCLKSGGKAALLMDQNTPPSEGGVFVDFFGLPVPISKAVAALSTRSEARVVCSFCVPEEDGTYTAYALPPLQTNGKGRSAEEITQAVARTIESEIRKRPGFWLWAYKRWKYVPEGTPLEQYPFYARRYRGGDR